MTHSRRTVRPSLGISLPTCWRYRSLSTVILWLCALRKHCTCVELHLVPLPGVKEKVFGSCYCHYGNPIFSVAARPASHSYVFWEFSCNYGTKNDASLNVVAAIPFASMDEGAITTLFFKVNRPRCSHVTHEFPPVDRNNKLQKIDRTRGQCFERLLLERAINLVDCCRHSE